jgi:putative Ca2+/H+ antiporter (TMEM165/GDT1 family)
MVVADGLAIIVGKMMGKRIPERAVKIIAAIVFFAAGTWTIAAAIWQS